MDVPWFLARGVATPLSVGALSLAHMMNVKDQGPGDVAENDDDNDTDTDTERDPDEPIKAKHGDVSLTLLFPPFSASDDADGPLALPPHDPVRARQIVESLGTVEEVLEQLPDRVWADVPQPEVRADLDLVVVGCWGNEVHIVEPALGSDLLARPLDEEIERQRALHPQARIVASVDMDYGNSFLEDAVYLPSGEHVHVFGWDCDDNDGWELYGDPEELLRALGVDRAAAEEAGFDLDEEICERDWPVLGELALAGSFHGYGARLMCSVFRVRHTSSAAFDAEEVWMGRW